MSDRNLNPHAEARVAMAIWSHEYAYDQKGGSMDFWDSRTAGQKATCVSFVNEIRGLPRADGTPAPLPISVGTLEGACEAVRRYVEGKEWGGGKFSMHDVGWNERVADCLANIRAELAAEGEQ